MKTHQKVKKGTFFKNSTDCCAMCQISGINNDTDSNEILEFLKAQKKEALENKDVYVGKDTGQTFVTCVVTLPDEEELMAKLKKLGFIVLLNFPRRVGYPKGRNILMGINVLESERL